MKIRNVTALLLAVLMACSVLSGCSGGETGVRGSEGQEYQGIPLTSEPITLKVWESTSGADTFVIEAGKRFNELYPNIRVEYENVEMGDALGKVLLDGPSGNGPDLFAAPNNTASTLVSSGLVMPTTSTLVDDKVEIIPEARAYAENLLTAGSVTAMTYQDELYGVPIASEGYAVFYNRALISDDEIPRSFEDLVTWCADFNAKNPGKYGFLMNVSEIYYTITFCTQTPEKRLFGEFGTDDTVTNLNTQECVNNFAWMAEHLRPVMDIPSADISQSGFQSQFVNGNAAMFVTGLWDVSVFQDAGIDFGVTTLPTLPGTDTIPEVFSTARMIYTSSFSSHINEANAFALFLVSDEMQQLRYELCGSCPTTSVSVDSPYMDGFAQQMAHSYPCPVINKMNAVWDAMNSASKVIWDCKETGPALTNFVQNALSTADTTILNS